MRRSKAPSQQGRPFKNPLLSRQSTTGTGEDQVQVDSVVEPRRKKLKADLPAPSRVTVNGANKQRKLVDEQTGACAEQYNIVWRKPSSKKHKVYATTWDSDGILTIENGEGIVKTLDGKMIGKASLSIAEDSLKDGTELRIAGREIQIVSRIGTLMLTEEKKKDEVNDDFRARGRANMRAFQNPVMHDISDLINMETPKIVKSRHDPNSPNSLVMPRPSIDYQEAHGKRHRPIVDVVVDPIICQHLRDHQREGVQFLYKCVMGFRDYDGEGAILADEMGLGKTLQTIALAWTLIKQTPFFGDPPIAKRILIVCPTSLIANWKKEFKKWLGDERCRTFVVDSSANLNDFIHGRVFSVMIIGYEKLRNIQEELKQVKFDLVVCDEGHRLKGQNLKIVQVVKAMETTKRIILTGTPIQNDLGEFHAMVDFVNPSLLGSYAKFKRVFEDAIVRSRQPDCSPHERDIGQERSQELNTMTRMFLLRRTAEDHARHLPPKTEYVLFCKPTDTQLAAYRHICGRADILLDGSTSLSCIGALKKLCNCPSLLANDAFAMATLSANDRFADIANDTDSGKIQFLRRFLYQLSQCTQEKLVLVSNYTQTLDIIQTLCEENRYSYFRLDGSTPSGKRQTYVDRFNDKSNKTFIFLLSSKSGGMGLNLVGASRLILFDTDWNPSVDRQAMARIHRDGQTRPVHIYRLLTTGMIDEKIYQRQITKQRLSDSFMDQKEHAAQNQFSLEDLRDLFTLQSDTPCQTHDLLNCACLGQFSAEGGEKPENLDELHTWMHILPNAGLKDPILAQSIDSVTFLFVK